MSALSITATCSGRCKPVANNLPPSDRRLRRGSAGERRQGLAQTQAAPHLHWGPQAQPFVAAFPLVLPGKVPK